MHPAWKIAWSLFIVWHLLMMTASMSAASGLTKELVKLTDPYQWTFGLHQNWPMFAPNPRLETSWLEAEGKLDDGTVVPLELPHGMPDPEGTILLYDRSGKLERNASTRDHIRAAFVRWYCRTHEPALAKVRFTLVRQPTPPPGSNPGPRSEWKVQRRELEEWRCKGH